MIFGIIFAFLNHDDNASSCIYLDFRDQYSGLYINKQLREINNSV